MLFLFSKFQAYSRLTCSFIPVSFFGSTGHKLLNHICDWLTKRWQKRSSQSYFPQRLDEVQIKKLLISFMFSSVIAWTAILNLYFYLCFVFLSLKCTHRLQLKTSKAEFIKATTHALRKFVTLGHLNKSWFYWFFIFLEKLKKERS